MNQVLPFPQRPIMASPVTSLPYAEDLPGLAVYEPKFDGHRAMLFVARGACRIQSRWGVDITSAFPEIAAAAVEWLPGGAVIDGEIVIWGNGSADFSEFQRRLSGQGDVRSLHGNTVSFVAFDVLAGAGMDMRASPFRVRRHALEILLEDALPPLHLVPQTRRRDQAEVWLKSYSESRVGIEGVVAKGVSTSYRPDTAAWERVCIQESAEFVVWAVAGGLSLPTRLMLATFEAGVGLRRTGWTAPVAARDSQLLGQALAPPRGAHPWSGSSSTTDVPGWTDPREEIHLAQPHLVVEVTTMVDAESTFIRQRPDLAVEDLNRSSDRLGDYLR